MECEKFNAIFSCSQLSKSPRLNILFFCATNYGPETQKKFGKKGFFLADSSAWKYIDEAIILDLSSEKKRKDFFGLTPSNPLLQVIELVISKPNTVYSAKWTDHER